MLLVLVQFLLDSLRRNTTQPSPHITHVMQTRASTAIAHLASQASNVTRSSVVTPLLRPHVNAAALVGCCANILGPCSSHASAWPQKRRIMPGIEFNVVAPRQFPPPLRPKPREVMNREIGMAASISCRRESTTTALIRPPYA